jgi:hypothetical protein
VTILHTRIGFEVELIAPAGSSRRALADRIALDNRGQVARTFHIDSEPSLVPGMGHFWHLTPGFTIQDRHGADLASLVDDVTIVADLQRDQLRRSETAATTEDAGRQDEHSYRILSDDIRLLRLVADHSHPDTPFDRVLDKVASLFGTTVETVGAVRRLRDRAGASIAMATALASGRERPCEIVTPPLRRDHEAALEALLRPARELGFAVPVEAAVHLHLDADPYRSAPAFANLVRLFGHWREALRTELGTNPACTRLQALPSDLIAFVDSTTSLRDDGDQWRRLQTRATDAGLNKYFDINLTSLLIDSPTRNTVEVRILPGLLHGAEITRRAALIEALLTRCRQPAPIPRPSTSEPAAMARELRALATFIPSAEGTGRA